MGEYTYKVQGDKDEDGDGVLDMINKTGYYSQMLTVERKAELGGVVIYPNSGNGFEPETVPAGKYDIWLYGSSSAPIARIVLEINIGETTLVDESAASAHGVTLSKMDASDPDYNKNMGADNGADEITHQYRLTYINREALASPQYAALNISGFSYGQAVGEYTYQVQGDKDEDGDGVLDMINTTGYYSQMLIVEKKTELGGVVIYPNSKNGFEPETIPAGKYDIWLYGSSNAPIARIVMDIE